MSPRISHQQSDDSWPPTSFGLGLLLQRQSSFESVISLSRPGAYVFQNYFLMLSLLVETEHGKRPVLILKVLRAGYQHG